jgi:hypothetical protein
MHGGAAEVAAPVEGGAAVAPVAEVEGGKRRKRSKSRSKNRYMRGGATEAAPAVENTTIAGGDASSDLEAGKRGKKGTGCPPSQGWRKSQAKGHKNKCVKMGTGGPNRRSAKYHKKISSR